MQDHENKHVFAATAGRIKAKIGGRIYDARVALHERLHKHKKPKRTSLGRRRTKELIFITVALAYPIAQFLVFYVAVNINSILLAFQSYSSATGVYSFTGIGNFQKAFSDLIHDSVLQASTKNSFLLYAVNLLIGMPVSLFASYFICKKMPAGGLFKVMLFLPSIISGIVMTLMFQYFVEIAIPFVFEKLGTTVPDLISNPDYTFKTMIVYNMWINFAGAMVLYLGAMSRVPESVVEYARLDGLGFFGEFIHITFPLIFPTITTFLVTGISAIFTSQAGLYNFFAESAPYTSYTFGYYLFVQIIGKFSSLALYPYAAAYGIIFTLIAAPITLLMKYLLEKFGPSTEY